MEGQGESGEGHDADPVELGVQLLEREDGVVRVTGGRFLAFQSEVVRREGEFTCKRCGASLSVGHFMKLEAGELGPFGSSCIRKVTGRESE
jgi:hypothetical protein